MKTNIKSLTKVLGATCFGLALLNAASFAQTDGSARMAVTISDFTGDPSADHWTVAWVTTSSDVFIKTLRKQGSVQYGWTSTQWSSHCGTWNTARGGTTGSQVVDGYTSATATTYTGTNSPIILTWNCRDTNNVLVADGNYKFWVQYAEDASGQGPVITSGLLWTKGPSGVTNNYSDQGANFSAMQVAWTPSTPSTVAPTITSAAPTSTGTVGVPYNFTCTATGTPVPKFTATGLPTGLTISTNGVISGRPTAAGTFSGTVTATNGTLPNGTKPFNIVVSVVPASFTSVRAEGTKLVMIAKGPTNGICAVLTSTNANASTGQWKPVATNSFGAGGSFSYTNAMDAGVPRKFYRLRVP